MTKLTQLALDQQNIDCGMSYVFQLNDGSFFLIDGGYFTPGEEDRLYAYLNERSGGKIHIAGWFFSHAHQDHVGAFINFIRKYAKNVVIDQLLYNFQPMDFSDLPEEMDWRENDPATFREFYRAIDAYCPEARRVILHTGDQVRFGELTIDVLYTHEDLDIDVSKVRFNDCSTVIRATVNQQRILFLGDVFVEGERILLRNPEALASDIVQVSHHGFSGPTAELYKKTGAKVALWPSADYVYEKIVSKKEREANEYLLNDAGINEHLVSGYGTVELTLPYFIE